MCDGQEWVEAKWNCVFKPDFENPSGSIFSEQRGIIYQDCHAPMGEGHVYPPGEHAGYYTAAGARRAAASCACRLVWAAAASCAARRRRSSRRTCRLRIV